MGCDLLAKCENRQKSRACISNRIESELDVMVMNLYSAFFYLHIQVCFYKQLIYGSQIRYQHICSIYLYMKPRRKEIG